MTNEIVIKDPDEVRVVSMNWTDALNSGASVSAISSVAGSPSGLTFASNTVVSSSVTSTKVSGGSAGTDYTVTWTVTTSDGETLEESGLLRVRSSTT